MTFQEPRFPEVPNNNANNRPQVKMHPRDQRINAFLLSFAEVIAWIGRLILLLASINIIFQAFDAGIFLEISITVIATILFFHITEKPGLARFFNWTVENWKESEVPANRAVYKFITTATNVFLVVITVVAGIFFAGYLIDILNEVGLLTIFAIFMVTELIILFFEKILPIVDRVISPRMIVDDPNTDEQNNNGEE